MEKTTHAPEPLLVPGQTYDSVSEKIGAVVIREPSPLFWWATMGVGFSLVMVLMMSVAWLFIRGVGVWGINIPVAWGFAIINFVWWIGIGHAGTLISAILLLMRQHWRNSINRFAEAMTLFAVACAGMFPLMHLGRPQVFYWLFPYPDTMSLWPQWRSPLVWDVFAVSTYFTVSLIFWYVGLIPDLATMRDRANAHWKRVAFGIVSLGWRGEAGHWQRYQAVYLLLAALATPLVASVHSVVGLDFAVSIVPGWHSTIFPPYFVAGAIYSGFAMVLTLVIPVRAAYRLHGLITQRHMDAMGLVMLAMGLIVGYGYLCETFFAFYSGNRYEQYLQIQRAMGPYAWAFWALIAFNIVIPQALWWRAARRNMLALFLIAISVNIGMWLERFVIIVVSLARDYIPSSWEMYRPTIWDWGTFLGTIGFFTACMFLFIRFVPMISMHEMRELIHREGRESEE
ncbi:MAG: NrfD/PsrC family molybdoenzyme membrane anchor subunit [Candidatus Sumerlaeia bacterium]